MITKGTTNILKKIDDFFKMATKPSFRPTKQDLRNASKLIQNWIMYVGKFENKSRDVEDLLNLLKSSNFNIEDALNLIEDLDDI